MCASHYLKSFSLTLPHSELKCKKSAILGSYNRKNSTIFENFRSERPQRSLQSEEKKITKTLIAAFVIIAQPLEHAHIILCAFLPFIAQRYVFNLALGIYCTMGQRESKSCDIFTSVALSKPKPKSIYQLPTTVALMWVPFRLHIPLFDSN